MEIPTGKIEELENCPMGRCMCNVRQYDSPADARRKVEQLYADAVAVYERNKEKATNNKRISEYVLAVVRNFGYPESYMAYKSDRSRTKTKMQHGWVRELFRSGSEILTDPKKAYDEKIADIVKWEDEVSRQHALEEIAKTQDAKERANLRTLIVIAIKHGLTEQADAEAVLKAILAKDKYLYLAYWMRRNRGDWSDGYYYAERGIAGFAVESDQDKEIVESVTSHFQDFEDGRVFRDCGWTYDKIFALADQELLKDMETISAMCSDEF